MDAKDGHILALLMEERSEDSQKLLLAAIEDSGAKEIAKGLINYVNFGTLQGPEWVKETVKHMMTYR